MRTNEIKCTKCGARGWETQNVGDECRWEYNGVKCTGVLRDEDEEKTYAS